MNRVAEHFRSGDESREEMHRQATLAIGKGDVYTAVKLLRKLVREVPDWGPPYRTMAAIYKQRREWKPVLHYAFGLLECEPGDREALQDMGLAATAIGKGKVARIAWNKLGYQEELKRLRKQPQTIALSLATTRGPEIVMAERRDPVQAILRSIPQPGSEYHYGDRLLFDLQNVDKVLIGDTTYPVYRVLQRLHRAHNQTFSAILHTSDRQQLDFLRKLCSDRGLGFDNWSKAERQTNWKKADSMEYYRELYEDSDPIAFTVVALAAKKPSLALDVLRTWQQITLVDFNRLFRMG